MNMKNLKGHAARTNSIGRGRRRAMTMTILGAVCLAGVVLLADDRTVLKPGWNMFSVDQDIEVGKEVRPDAERQLRMLNNDRVDSYIDKLGHRLAAKAPGASYPYQFKVINDRAINAFALPGGPIYINRGVLETADNEAQLAGVIAHEISHVALRHGTNQASKASAAQVPLAILGGMLSTDSTKALLAELGASFAVNSILLKYSRSAESQADVMGTQILYDAGYDPRAMAQFFEKLDAQQKGSGPVEFFSNHPNPDNRIERVTQEVQLLGGGRREFSSSSREFDDSKRYVLGLPAPKGQPLQASTSSRTATLRIVSASYGASNKFIDVRQQLQARVQNDRLDLEVNNSSMGGDPISEEKMLVVRYEWQNRSYDVTVREHARLSIPAAQQSGNVSAGRQGTERQGADSAVEDPSDRFVNVDTSLVRMSRPDNWQVHGQGDAITIAPRGGLIDDGEGRQALVYGVIVNMFEPHAEDGYGQGLQGPGNRQANGGQQASSAQLDRFTDQLVQELRLSNRNMRVVRSHERISVDGDQGSSTYLSNDLPTGGRETDWLVTAQHPDGLLFIVFTAPEREFQRYEGTFHEMLRSVRIKR